MPRHNFGPVEPHADIRQAATVWFQIYTACVDAGFNPEQAMEIVTTLIEAHVDGTHEDD